MLAPCDGARGTLWDMKDPRRQVQHRAPLNLAKTSGVGEDSGEEHDARTRLSDLSQACTSDSDSEASDSEVGEKTPTVKALRCILNLLSCSRDVAATITFG